MNGTDRLNKWGLTKQNTLGRGASRVVFEKCVYNVCVKIPRRLVGCVKVYSVGRSSARWLISSLFTPPPLCLLREITRALYHGYRRFAFLLKESPQFPSFPAETGTICGGAVGKPGLWHCLRRSIGQREKNRVTDWRIWRKNEVIKVPRFL